MQSSVIYFMLNDVSANLAHWQLGYTTINMPLLHSRHSYTCDSLQYCTVTLKLLAYVALIDARSIIIIHSDRRPDRTRPSKSNKIEYHKKLNIVALELKRFKFMSSCCVSNECTVPALCSVCNNAHCSLWDPTKP